MHRYAWLCMVWFFFQCIPDAHAAPLEAYGRLPALENLAISPDGKELAYVTSIDEKRTVIVVSIDSRKLIWAGIPGKDKLRDLSWADDDELLITTSRTAQIFEVIAPEQEYTITQAYSLSSKVFRPLIRNVDDSLNVAEGVPESRTINGHTVVFVLGVHFINNRGVLALFSIDLVSGRSKLVEPGSANSRGWWLDQSGNVVAAVEYDDATRRWSLKLRIHDQWVESYAVVAPIDTPDIQGIGPDGNSLIVQTFEEGRFGIRQISLTDGSLEKPSESEASRGDPVVDPADHRVIGYRSVEGRTKYVFSREADQEAWDSVAGAYADSNVELISWSADRKRIVVRVDGTREGSEFEMIDLNTNLATDIGPAYQGISARDVSEVKFISYAAVDGRKIPAFLTLPHGLSQKNLPLIVLPHGGPVAQDDPGFDWWAQALASRGYVVLQPEFRGSTGFGWAHLSAAFGEWGRKMQTDLSDGVRYLASQGLVDPKRVCIVGGSYGGYAALAGPTLDRGVYRCAVSVAGISDPQNFLNWRRGRQRTSDSISIRFWTRLMGEAGVDDPKLAAISPLRHAAEADAPILLIHGNDDTVVPIEQSEDMENALRSAGKPVTLVRLKSEDHWLSRSETRGQMLQATVAFLEANNPAN